MDGDRLEEPEAVAEKPVFDIAILDTLDVATLEQIKAKATELLKGKKEEIKNIAKETKEQTEARRASEAKAKLVVGAKITFTMKNQVREAEVLKVSDATATVKLPEGFRYIRLKFIQEVTPPAKAKPVEGEAKGADEADVAQVA